MRPTRSIAHGVSRQTVILPPTIGYPQRAPPRRLRGFSFGMTLFAGQSLFQGPSETVAVAPSEVCAALFSSAPEARPANPQATNVRQVVFVMSVSPACSLVKF